jgi:hypothetical protein
MLAACITPESSMRVTTEWDEVTCALLIQRARVEKRSMSALLSTLIAEGLRSEAPRLIQKGRFTVIAGPSDGRKVSTAQGQAVIDGDRVPVRRPGVHASLDIHTPLFGTTPPTPKSRRQLKDGIAALMRAKHARG